MQDHQYARIAFVRQLPSAAQQVALVLGVQAGGGLVQQQVARFTGRARGVALHQHARELHTLLFAARQFGIAAATQVGSVGQVQRLRDQRIDLGGRQFGKGVRAHGDHFAHVQVEGQARLLRKDGATPCLPRQGHVGKRGAVQAQLAVLRRELGRQCPQQRGLARAVGPQQAHDFAGAYRQRDISQDARGPARQRQLVCGKRHPSLRPRASSHRKNGPPTSPVTRPIGNSAGTTTVRAIQSASTSARPPASTVAGSSQR
ncbi:hypothetical protein D3C86_821780 [compost metagenome]